MEIDNVCAGKDDGDDDVQCLKGSIYTFDISGTSKFSAAREVANAYASGRGSSEVLELNINRTLAYGSKYGLGVFCYMRSGEQQIGWVPEKNSKLHKRMELMCQQPSFRIRLIKATTKRISETFSRIE